MTPTNLSYPIGTYQAPELITPELRATYIADIAAFPGRLTTATVNLSESQLDTPYRPGGWTVRQLVHHVADSHMNAYIRCKLTLTEDNPTIRPYDEKAWAKLPEASSEPITLSLDLLTHLHRRWVKMLQAISNAGFSRTYYHPGDQVQLRLDTVLGMYAWHSNHHLAHVTALIEREGW